MLAQLPTQQTAKNLFLWPSRSSIRKGLEIPLALALDLVEEGPARVLIAPLAQMFLIGTEIDYEETMLESGFKFRNPNVVESCGCGESVKFRDAPAG